MSLPFAAHLHQSEFQFHESEIEFNIYAIEFHKSELLEFIPIIKKI